jgi:hypothetical protein
LGLWDEDDIRGVMGPPLTEQEREERKQRGNEILSAVQAAKVRVRERR